MFESAAFPVIVSDAAGKIISKNSAAKKFMPKLRRGSSILTRAKISGSALRFMRDDTPFKNAVIARGPCGDQEISIYLSCPQIQEDDISFDDVKVDLSDLRFDITDNESSSVGRMCRDIATAFAAICRRQMFPNEIIDVVSALKALGNRLSKLRAVGKRISVKCADIVVSEKFFALNNRTFLFSAMRAVYIALRASKSDKIELIFDYKSDLKAIEICAVASARDDIRYINGDVSLEIIAPEC